MIAPWYQLGYIIPHRQTDLDGYQFYRVAPEGMMLVTTGMDLAEYSLAAVSPTRPASLAPPTCFRRRSNREAEGRFAV